MCLSRRAAAYAATLFGLPFLNAMSPLKFSSKNFLAVSNSSPIIPMRRSQVLKVYFSFVVSVFFTFAVRCVIA